ncbi:MAG: type VII secretion protein EssC [Lachnospiraceae bacterium]|nr:type VII secretion protein EssC [Lachnospiraceae bacterium]
MSIVLSVYSPKAFKEFLLPSINNADYSIVLQKEYFDLKEDLVLLLEILENQWRVRKDLNYTVEKEFEDYCGHPIKDRDLLKVFTSHKEQISIIVKEVESVFHSYEKFSLENLEAVTIGKNEENDIIYNYLKLVSGEHVVIRRSGNSFKIINKSLNGTYVNSVRIDTETELQFGDYINIMGLHLIYLGEILAVDLRGKEVRINRKKLRSYKENTEKTVLLRTVEKKSGGKKIYHRSPRSYEKLETGSVEIEAPPEPLKTKMQPLFLTLGPSVTMALPMLLGCMMMIYASQIDGGSSLYMYSGLVMAVSSAAIGVAWAMINIRHQKKEERETEELRFQAYSQYLVEKADQIKEKYDNTVRMLEDMYPPAEHCISYDEMGNVLWNRNRTHEDFLTHRLGIGDIPFSVKIDIPKKRFRLLKDELAEKPEFIQKSYETLYNVPVTLNLREHHLIGLVGGESKRGAIQVAQILSAQIAANNCYTDVKMGYIYNKNHSGERSCWEFAKWLPHVWSEDKKNRYIASCKEEASDVFYELTKIFRERSEIQRKEKREIPKPCYVIFISDLSMLEGELFSKYAFEESTELGLFTVLMAESCEELPNNCEFIIQNDEKFQGMYDVFDREEEKTKIKFDALAASGLENFARRLSGLQVLELEEGGEIPESLTFLEMLGVSRLEEIPVKDLWAKNRTYENIRGLVGQKAGGVPCYLDVHEKYHGPHGLVAGTTGSGKSETLQTYMLSLAIHYSPDDIAFFIIDYKGGGMANLFEGLPHMVGQISNLSGNQVKRAMISIKSENRRRQKIFNENGVNNINSYTKLYKNGEAALPVPHLFIIIDEFAELKREEPEFMKELISVAQVGRSLGVHMILATQKPGGTVDDNIWSNSKFRLCLRVQDKQDSNDMLHKADAAYITQAGRCYLQVGNDEVYELFQSGFSGALYDEEAGSQKNDLAQLISVTGKVEMSGNTARISRKKQPSHLKEKTQLEAVKEYLAEIAGENYHPQQLWMPVLPDTIYLDSFPEYKERCFADGNWKNDCKEGCKDWSMEIVLGKVDDPENQRQMPLTLDFARSGHVAVCGTIVSGKSTMLQTMIYALLTGYTPNQLHIYGLDFSSKMMSAFADAPQVGGIMYESDLEKISKFFNMMESILKDRKAQFSGGNYSQYIRVHGAVLPAILIFIDNYSGFKEKTAERYEDFMIRLAKEGVNYGIYLIVSGAGFGMNEITLRVGENMDTVLCLNLPDKFAYGDMLHSYQLAVLPESGIKGRGLAVVEGRILEYQTALALEAENDYARIEEIRAVCMAMRESWHGKTARRIPEIPKKPIWSGFEQLDEFEKMCETKSYLPVGYDAANASVYGINLRDIYCYLIWGGERTGKTNYLKVCIQSALKKQSHICIIDNAEKGLQAYQYEESVCYAATEQEVFDFFRELLPEFKRRNQIKNQMLQEDYEEDEIYDRMSEEIPYFIFISDLSWFVSFIYNAEMNMSDFLENILAKGRLHNIYFISELALEKRDLVTGYAIYELFAGYKTGIHFGGKVDKNPVLSFEYLSYKEAEKSAKAGIGQIPGPEEMQETKQVVVPLARR